MKKIKSSVFLAVLVLSGVFAANSQPVSSPQGQGAVDEETARFQELTGKWDRETAALNAQHKPERGHHDPALAIQYLRSYAKGKNSDRVFLLLLEDGFCSTWAGYPDCGAIEIKGYERFLENFPDSALKEEIELKMARDYFSMAWLWLNGKGERSEKWSDLFRAQSLEITRKLARSSNPQIRQAASELEQKLGKDFPRPIAPVPSQVLSPDYY
jgi:hypothetical protein